MGNSGVSADFTNIDLATWERSAAFFKTFSEPYHGVCLRVDCTATFRFAKEHRLSIFWLCSTGPLSAAHGVENFRMRAVGGEIRRYERINGGSAVGRTPR